MRLSRLALASLFTLSAAAAAQQAPAISEPVLRGHLAFLADDLFEGRGTGQRGGDLAVRYLETQAAIIGLQQIAAPRAVPSPCSALCSWRPPCSTLSASPGS